MNKIWKNPPKYKGWNPNKRALAVLAKMVVSLMSIPAAAVIAVKLKSIASRLEMMATVVDRHVDAYPNVYSVWTNLSGLRTALMVGEGGRDELLSDLEQDLATLGNLVDNNVMVNANEMRPSRAMSTFIAKQSFVNGTYHSAENSLEKETKRLSRLQANPPSVTNTTQQNVCRTAIRSLSQIVEILVSVKANLALLETYCRQSPTLARRVARLVNTKRLSEFIANPVSCKIEARKLHTQLLLILDNIQCTLDTEHTWNDMQDEYQADFDLTPSTYPAAVSVNTQSITPRQTGAEQPASDIAMQQSTDGLTIASN